MVLMTLDCLLVPPDEPDTMNAEADASFTRPDGLGRRARRRTTTNAKAPTTAAPHVAPTTAPTTTLDRDLLLDEKLPPQ